MTDELPPPKLDYRPVPRPGSEPFRWGRFLDQLSAVVMVLILIAAVLGCLFWRFCAGIMLGL